MSDFIFSKKPIKDGIITKKFQDIYNENLTSVREVHTKFGTLAIIDNHYNGFSNYETDEIIFSVVGGPVLLFRDNNFISNKNSNEGTYSIYDRWMNKNQIKWDKDLSGPFIVIFFNKKKGSLKIICDIMSFIPVYLNNNDSDLLVGSHINLLGSISKNKIDKTSIVDLILNEIITFPFTAFKNITQISPASINNWSLNEIDGKFKQNIYWEPIEPKNKISLRKLSNKLNRSFNNYINCVSNVESSIGSFFSGGEDSRTVIDKLNQNNKVDSFVFSENLNRETYIASKVNNVYKTNLTICKRQKSYYYDILAPSSNLIGICGDYAHSHVFNLAAKYNLKKYDVFMGGFLSDTLLKGHHIKLKTIPKYLKFLPIRESKFVTKNINIKYHKLFNNDIIDLINSRRNNHLSKLKKIRPKSYIEWFSIWPISQHNDAPNIHCNRRLLNIFEPFTDVNIIKIASQASQEQKLNKYLFNMAMKPFLKKTKLIPHSNGSYPYFSWYLNIYFKFIYKIYKSLKRLLFQDKIYSGSWVEWNKFINEKSFKSFFKKTYKFINLELGSHLYKSCESILNEKILTVSQKRMLIQISYHLSIIKKKQP